MKTSRSVFFITALGVAVSSFASIPSEDHQIPSSGDDAIVKASQAIRKNHLIEHPDDCYAYKITRQTQKYYEVEVEEYHNHRECPGDPNAFPHLFSVRVSRSTGKLTSDAKSAGKFTNL